MIALLLGAAAARLHGMAPALITFESPELYRLHNAAGFWGPVTSSVDWCEHTSPHTIDV